ncbi:RraA family protein [Paenarthrobacter nicotinovorans]|uniref:RraA family protein n=1 Tax=Paenarthrobacter nicotinovorans TaxID=29320 RepID=UPI00380414A4
MFIQESADNIHVATDTWNRAPLADFAELAQHPVALIGDAQQRMGLMSASIKQVTPGLQLAGTILPVLTREGDNLAIHRALDLAVPGDVLVINGNAETNRAVFGDLLGQICVAKGVAGVIIDGATRDVVELTSMGLPVFARGISPAGPWKNGPGRVGAAVACGNIVCYPGDVVIGDADGLVVIPKAELSAVLQQTLLQDAGENRLRERIRAELTPRPAHV